MALSWLDEAINRSFCSYSFPLPPEKRPPKPPGTKTGSICQQQEKFLKELAGTDIIRPPKGKLRTKQEFDDGSMEVIDDDGNCFYI